MGIAFNRAKYFMVCQDTVVNTGFIYPDSVKKAILEHNPQPKILTSAPQLSLF
jgi:predicted DNA-binding helix-hairpin-helix protein